MISDTVEIPISTPEISISSLEMDAVTVEMGISSLEMATVTVEMTISTLEMAWGSVEAAISTLETPGGDNEDPAFRTVFFALSACIDGLSPHHRPIWLGCRGFVAGPIIEVTL